jgi:hypothetical protein
MTMEWIGQLLGKSRACTEERLGRTVHKVLHLLFRYWNEKRKFSGLSEGKYIHQRDTHRPLGMCSYGHRGVDHWGIMTAGRTRGV